MTMQKQREDADRIIAALDAEPMDDADGDIAVRALGIDVTKMAARLRKMVADHDEGARQERFAAAKRDRVSALADLHAADAPVVRPRQEQIRRIRSHVARLPPEQVSMHFMKFEEATDEDLARLEVLARHLVEPDGS